MNRTEIFFGHQTTKNLYYYYSEDSNYKNIVYYI